MALTKLQANAIAADAITTSVIAANAIQTSDIADNAITSAKLDTNLSVSGNVQISGRTYRSNIAVANSGASGNVIDCLQGNYFTHTAGSSTTYTFSNPPTANSYTFALETTLITGTLTWPAEVKWPSATAPSSLNTGGNVHLFIFTTDDGGTVWRGSSLTNYYG